MKQTNMRFLSSVFVLCVFGMTDAFAAPSVKMLGANTARVGSNATVVTSNTNPGASSQTQQRLGSVRAKTVTSAAPTSITSSANTNADSRISLGNVGLNKYLHAPSTTGTVKPTTTPVTPGVSDTDFTHLTDRVQDLEDGIENKQDALSAGTGLVLEDNTMYLSDDIAQLPSQLDDMQDEIDTKVTQAQVNTTLNNSLGNYYTKYEVQNILNDITGSDVKTIYDYATGERKYVTVVDTFNESILN